MANPIIAEQMLFHWKPPTQDLWIGEKKPIFSSEKLQKLLCFLVLRKHYNRPCHHLIYQILPFVYHYFLNPLYPLSPSKYKSHENKNFFLGGELFTAVFSGLRNGPAAEQAVSKTSRMNSAWMLSTSMHTGHFKRL